MKKHSMLFVGMVAAIVFAQGCTDEAPTGDELDVESPDSDGKADAPGSENYTYFTARQDIRRCASPMCGGKWVSRVNRANLRCADGSMKKECYVAEIGYSNTGLNDDQIDGARGALQALYRGSIELRNFGEVGSFGVLEATEVWAANNDLAPEGVFVRVTDNGIRCITTPCYSLNEAKLNAALEADIAELDFYWSGANEDEISKAYDALANDGLLVAGYRYYYKDHGQWAKGRDVSQFWRRIVPVASTGGTGQVGDTCGARSQVTCADGLFCSWDVGETCGWADATGTCAVPPEACIQLYDPVCGCDRVTYGNACMAANAGQSVQYDGECIAE